MFDVAQYEATLQNDNLKDHAPAAFRLVESNGDSASDVATFVLRAKVVQPFNIDLRAGVRYKTTD
jgi:hypothetical protein